MYSSGFGRITGLSVYTIYTASSTFFKQEVAYLCFLFLLSASCTNTLYTFLFFWPLLKHFFLSKIPFSEGVLLFFLVFRPPYTVPIHFGCFYVPNGANIETGSCIFMLSISSFCFLYKYSVHFIIFLAPAQTFFFIKKTIFETGSCIFMLSIF